MKQVIHLIYRNQLEIKDTTDIVPIDNEDHVVAFGLLETSDAQALAAKIEELL